MWELDLFDTKKCTFYAVLAKFWQFLVPSSTVTLVTFSSDPRKFKRNPKKPKKNFKKIPKKIKKKKKNTDTTIARS